MVIYERDKTALVQLSKYRTLAEIKEVADTCSQPNWGGHDEEPLNPQAVAEAIQLLDVLPLSFASPDVSPEPLGSLAFGWRFAPSRAIVLSVSGRGFIEFAGLKGHSYEFHGRVDFGGELPEAVFQQLITVQGA